MGQANEHTLGRESLSYGLNNGLIKDQYCSVSDPVADGYEQHVTPIKNSLWIALVKYLLAMRVEKLSVSQLKLTVMSGCRDIRLTLKLMPLPDMFSLQINYQKGIGECEDM